MEKIIFLDDTKLNVFYNLTINLILFSFFKYQPAIIDLIFCSIGLATSGALEILDLCQNLFNGIVPSQIGVLSSLKALSLGDNRFHGSLPSQGKYS